MSPLELLFLLVFWTWVGCGLFFLRTTILPKTPRSATPREFGLSYKDVAFPATDGVQLSGWLIADSTPTRPWLILCHGLGTTCADLLDLAAALFREGYNLFLFDFRGHGESAGRVTSFGWWEQRDLEGALAFLGEQPEVPERPYGIVGVSMGGAVAIMVAARDERLGAVAVDGVYPDLEASLAHHVELLYRLPRMPFLFVIKTAYRIRFGVWPRHMSPQKAVERLSSRKLLVIQGSKDARVPLEGTKTLMERAGTAHELFVIEGAGHLEGLALDASAYVGKLTNFFISSL